jgi:hypothetical protein
LRAPVARVVLALRTSPLAAVALALLCVQAAFALTLAGDGSSSSPTPRQAARSYMLGVYGPDYDPQALTTLTWGGTETLQTATMTSGQALELYLDHLEAAGLLSCAGPVHHDEAPPESMYGTICFHEQGYKRSFGNGGAGATCPEIVPLGESSLGDVLGGSATPVVNAGSLELEAMGFATSTVSLHDLNEAGTRRATSLLVHFEPGQEGAPREYPYGGAAPTPGVAWEFFYVNWKWLDDTVTGITGEPSTTFSDTFFDDLYIHCRVDASAGGKVWNDSIVTPAVWKHGAFPPAPPS